MIRTINTVPMGIAANAQYQRHETKKTLLVLLSLVATDAKLRIDQLTILDAPGGYIEVYRKPKILLGSITSEREYEKGGAAELRFTIKLTFTPKT